MAIAALTGDGTTTSALALASAWVGDDAILVECDPSGGSLAAWLDVPVAPSLSSIVAAIARSDGRRTTDEDGIVDSMIRRAPGGLRFIPCPVSRREARRAVAEATRHVLPLLASGADTLLLDLGRSDIEDPRESPVTRTIIAADLAVVVHRQASTSPRAAAVRLERLHEDVSALAARREAVGAEPPLLLIVGERPFSPDEIAIHVGTELLGGLLTFTDDPLSAAVLAGRPGVSPRRLRRQPLLRDAHTVAARLAATIRDVRTTQSAALLRLDTEQR